MDDLEERVARETLGVEDPEHASKKLTDTERLSAIRGYLQLGSFKEGQDDASS